MTVDRFPELPEWIILDQIMSRLSKRDRARTAVLSKTWYHLNKTYPALDIDFQSFYKALYLDPCFRRDSPETCKSIESFRKRASKSLLRFSQQQVRLQSLRVKFGWEFHSQYESDLDRWVELALENKVEKLKLHCHSRDYKPLYSLPQPVYISATLTTLKLVQCVLDRPLSSLFRSLKKLTLSRCRLNDGPLVLKHPDCPFLESLTIDKCYGFDSILITDLVQLHTVKIGLTEVPVIVEIASQSVQKLSIDEDTFRQNSWKRINIDACNCLKYLYLYFDTILDHVLNALLSKLPLLEDLYVIGCNQLEAMQVSNPCLKTLMVCPVGSSRLKSIDINVPTIKNFIFRPSNEEHTEINVQADCCLETLVLCHADKNFHELVAKFPRMQCLWIFNCNNLEKIELPNLQLKRLHIVSCFELRVVKVASRELEMFCKEREDVNISIPNPEFQRCKTMLYGRFGLDSFREMLASLVKDKYVVPILCFRLSSL